MNKKYRWIRTVDEVTKDVIYYIEGYEYGKDIRARIFKSRVYNKVAMRNEYRYFPQIDNDLREEGVLGPESGFKYLKDAKRELVNMLNTYLTKGIDGFVR